MALERDVLQAFQVGVEARVYLIRDAIDRFGEWVDLVRTEERLKRLSVERTSGQTPLSRKALGRLKYLIGQRHSRFHGFEYTECYTQVQS